MALFHRATITPTKAELIAQWAPTRSWGPAADIRLDVIGSYRFDDPDGRVGMETHLVTAAGTLLQVPLTYRDEPLEGADDALIVEMQHSALGTRFVDQPPPWMRTLLGAMYQRPSYSTMPTASP